MKFLILIKITIAALFAFSLSNAHEGHDHDGPSQFQPKKGGVVKSTEEINVEAITKGKTVELYFYENDGKIKSKDSFTVSAEAKLPKSKKKIKLTLVEKTNSEQQMYFEISDGPKGTHRYTLILSLLEKNDHHKHKLSFTIEPK